jgi:hypothetical protein
MVRGAVALGDRCGTARRSRKPATPSARHRWTHFATVRTLTPAALAAA